MYDASLHLIQTDHTSTQAEPHAHNIQLPQCKDRGSLSRNNLGLGSFHDYNIIPMRVGHQWQHHIHLEQMFNPLNT